MGRAVTLLSGGMDSATCLAIALETGNECYALSFDYGQRHDIELQAARRIAERMGVLQHRTLKIDLGQLGGSALTDKSIDVPEQPGEGIPATYVPARNTIFLSYALAWAEVLDADSIYLGINAIDYSGYPDCRPEYLRAFQLMAKLATRRCVEGGNLEIRAPLLELGKAEIIRRGMDLGVDFSMTISCYQADEQGAACGRCDACRLRRAGFESAGVVDPTQYQG